MDQIAHFVKSEDQLADILTNAIFSKAFHNSLDQLGIGDIYAQTEGECWRDLWILTYFPYTPRIPIIIVIDLL